jgi:serine/threonine-protein kinase RsbW
MLKTFNIYKNRIASSIDGVCTVVSDLLSSLQEKYGPLEECILFELRVILNEILLNAIKHGNKEDVSKFVNITASVTKSGYVCLIVEDEGNGYDYKCRCTSRAAAEDGNDICSIMESGRGVQIVQSLCDKVKVNTKGNKIEVMKKLRNI